MSPCFSLAIGSGARNRKGEWLEVWYPAPVLNPSELLWETIQRTIGQQTTRLTEPQLVALGDALEQADFEEQAEIARGLLDSEQTAVICILADDSAPTDVPSAYLKLHLLSHRLVKPHAIDLSGIFSLLPNVAWTSAGAIDLAELRERQLQARRAGEHLVVNAVDKFPRMADYVMPSGVRIGDASRVRLGAYLGEGTTVMHEGFVNFNAGTEGPNMVEGRISAGVFIGRGSDLGGGCSTMGTLSGGGNIIISVGQDCLLGANSGLGIPFGDRCTLESGLYLTAGTKVGVLDDQGNLVEVVKAAQLAGKSDLLFRRNSRTGAVECLTNRSAIQLNDELHQNN